MREILFRGINCITEQWIYGGIVFEEADDALYGGEDIPLIKAIDDMEREVIPETVGQYTGLQDRNGVNIFEGDIVKTTTKITTGQAETVVRVFFSDLCASFMLSGGILCSPEFMHKNRKYAVIGNIHDTPELLKE
jgi:uncharacterized phage protein (TIGR01671 family)